MVAVAVYGLYGAATSKWDMSAKVEESGVFESFWDTLSFVVNGIVFFFSGVACINFFVRQAFFAYSTSLFQGHLSIAQESPRQGICKLPSFPVACICN